MHSEPNLILIIFHVDFSKLILFILCFRKSFLCVRIIYIDNKFLILFFWVFYVVAFSVLINLQNLEIQFIKYFAEMFSYSNRENQYLLQNSPQLK